MKRAAVGITGLALAAMLVVVPRGAQSQCCGDCNGDGLVTVDEIITAVNRALGSGICTQPGGQRFPASGQTTCWDEHGNVIACSGTGQDGQIQAGGALAYVDNGDGTISDLNTHLMWEKKSADGSIHDKSNEYVWAAAFSTFIGGLNAAGGFTGHTDWRLPNAKELQSIVNYENVDLAVSAAFNANCVLGCTVTTCSCTQSDIYTQSAIYWTATTLAHLPTDAWDVNFTNGSVSFSSKTYSTYARAVRGGL
jgi:hypothetical protein